MVVKNAAKLAVNESREKALKIIEAGFQAINTARIINSVVRRRGETLEIKNIKIQLAKIRRLLVVGVGKCALDAARTLEKILGKRITDGIIIDVRRGKLRKIKSYLGSHPLPDKNNIDATHKIIQLLFNLSASDLVIFIISGGGSTLLCQPKDLTCFEEAEILKCLMNSGADIQEINTIRKHLSFARGGFLAKYAYPARAIALIFSDVPGDKLEFVASGPTLRDTTTIRNAKRIMRKYDLERRCQLSKLSFIETPKDAKCFKKVTNILVANNRTGLEAMAGEAKKLGFQAIIQTSKLAGEASEAGKKIARALHQAKPKTVLLYGGETTVTIKNDGGRGGRSLELVLSGMRFLKPRETLSGIASDGRDNSNFAGAVGDIITLRKARRLNLPINEFLRRHQSYDFFKKIGDYLLTGYTGSNAADFVIALKDGK